MASVMAQPFNSFDNNNGGGGGGGGFYADGAQGGGQQQYQSGGGNSTSPGKKSGRVESAVTPVSVKRITSATATDGQLRLDDKEVNDVRIVGCISGINVTPTQFNARLEDGTGVIALRLYVTNDEFGKPKNLPKDLADGMYAHVSGRINDGQGGQRALTAYRILPVTDHNQITHHMLEVKYVELHRRLAQSAGPTTTTAGGGGAAAAAAGAGGAAGVYKAPEFSAGSRLNNIQKSVHDTIKRGAAAGGAVDGCPYQLVRESLPQVPEPQIHQAIEFLFNEGYIYTTVDDQHYNVTDTNV